MWAKSKSAPEEGRVGGAYPLVKAPFPPDGGLVLEHVFDTLPAMTSLRSALEDLMCTRVAELPDDRLVEEFSELMEAVAR